uniref:BED-type domain-containing protein n=1 Tax=Sphaeramia orbicularis TaxID=375764 RepID=A0A673AZV2_9TELE
MQTLHRSVCQSHAPSFPHSGNEMAEGGDGEESFQSPWPYLDKYMSLCETTDKNYVFRCLLCNPKKKLLSTSKTSNTNLRMHIQRMHPNKIASLDKEQDQAKKRSATHEEEHLDPSTQGSISQFFSGGTRNPVISQQRFDKLILNFIVQGLHPLQTVERPEFVELFKEILPYRHLISRRTLGRMLDDEYSSMKRTLTEELSTLTHVCTTTDAWSANNRSFLGVTIHWIDEKSLSICSGALACRRIEGHHTHNVLAEMQDNVHRDFNIRDKITVTTTDNGSNFVKAFSVFAEVQITSLEEENEEGEDDDTVFLNLTDMLNEGDGYEDVSLPPHQRCACHTLNLVATKDAETAVSQSDSFKKVSRSTVGKCQVIWNKQHRSTQASDIIQDKLGCQLPVPILTRWNFTYHAMEHLNTCILTKCQEFNETCEKLEVVRFKAAELTFIKEYVQTMAPLAKALDVLQSDKMAYAGALVPTITILVEKMEHLKLNTTFQHCNALVDAIISGIKKRFEYIYEDSRLLIASAAHPMFRLMYIPIAKKSCETNFVSAFQNLPLMKKILLKYNTGFPASAACERLFSVGKDIFRPKRNRLSDTNFEKLLLCRVNKHLL